MELTPQNKKYIDSLSLNWGYRSGDYFRGYSLNSLEAPIICG